MADDEMGERKAPAETVVGKIFIGIAVAAGSALISWFLSRATYVPPPPPKPAAQISPSTVVAQANATVEFSAKGSSVPSPETPAYLWRVSGLEPNKSPVARCDDKGATLSCRFVLPGTFAVSVDVVDTNGQSGSAASTITVSVPSGYLGLILSNDDANALRALLYDVDWVSLQSLVTRPIIILDPDSRSPVYAALADPPSGTADPPPWRGAAAGLKVAIPPLPTEPKLQFEIALAEIGLVPVTLPFSEVYTATERGLVDVGFLTFDDPARLTETSGR